MKLTQNKIVVVLLMLVALIGQATASTAMPCVHESMSTDMAMMNHTDMQSSQEARQGAEQTNEMECCQEQCQCPMTGCISLSMLVNNTFNSAFSAEQKILQFSQAHKSQVNASLYRPPIS